MADEAESATTNAPLSRLVSGALPRGHKVKPLVAEFGDYISVFTDPQRPADLEKLISSLPKGAKAVTRQFSLRTDGEWTQSSKDTYTLYADDVRQLLRNQCRILKEAFALAGPQCRWFVIAGSPCQDNRSRPPERTPRTYWSL